MATRNYTCKTESKRADEGAEKDRLLEMISAAMLERGLKTKDLQSIIPGINPKTVSEIRQCIRSAAKLERLQTLAVGLGLVEPTFNPLAANGNYSRAAA